MKRLLFNYHFKLIFYTAVLLKLRYSLSQTQLSSLSPKFMITLFRFSLVNVVWESLLHYFFLHSFIRLCPRGLVNVVIDCISKRFYYGYLVPSMFVLSVHISLYIHWRRASVALFYAFSYAPLWWIHCLHHVVHHCYSSGRLLPRTITKRLLSGNLHFIAHVSIY